MTMRHRLSGPVRVAVPAVALALALTGCSGSGGGSGSAGKDSASGPAGVISVEAARNVLRNYTKVNNAVNAAHDKDGIAAVEYGELLEQSQAALTQYPARSKKEQASYREPFDYPVKDARFYIPRKGTADVFMVDTRITGKGVKGNPRRLVAFKHVTGEGGAVWKAVAVGELQGSMPAVKRDADGLVTVLAPSARVGSTRLDDLRALSKDFYLTGGKKAAGRFADTSSVKGWKKSHSSAGSFDDNCVDGEYKSAVSAAETVYALKTTDGGALTLYDFALDYSNWPKARGVQCNSELQLRDMPEVTKIYMDGRTTTSNLDRTDALIALAVVPPSGKPIRVTGYEFQMVNASGL